MAEESLGKAVLELVADLNPLNKGLDEGKANAEGMATSTSRSFKNGITKAAIPAAAALGVVAIGLHKAVDAAQEDQVAQARLEAAFRSAKVPLGEYRNKVEETVQSSAQLGFKSGDVKSALGTLIVAAGNGPGAFKALATAQDIARFKGVDLSTASQMLAKTMGGSARAAKTLGLVIPPVTRATDQAAIANTRATTALTNSYPSISKMTAAEKASYYAKLKVITAAYSQAKATASVKDKQALAAEAIKLVNDKLHGQADAYAKTAAGAKDKMGAELQLLEENIGKALLPALTMVSTKLAEATGWMAKHATVAKIVIGVVAGLATVILAVNAALKINSAFTSLANGVKKVYALLTGAQAVATDGLAVSEEGATVAQEGLNVAMDANPIGMIILGIGALIAIGVLLITHLGDVESAFTAVWGVVKTAAGDAIDWLKSNWPLVLGILTGPIGLAVAAIYKYWGTIKSDLTTAWNDISGAVSGFGNKIKDGVVNAVTGTADDVWNLLKGIGSKIEGALDTIEGWGTKLGSKVYHGVIGGVTGIGYDVWNILNNIGSYIEGKLSLIEGWGSSLANHLWSGIKSIGSDLAGIGGVIVDPIRSAINALIDLLDGLHISIGKVSVLGQTIFGGMDWHPFHIPHLAEGGIVTRPTLALIGEAGPEAVIPLGKTAPGPGGNAAPVVNVTVNGVVGNEAEVAKKIGLELQRLKARGLNFGLA